MDPIEAGLAASLAAIAAKHKAEAAVSVARSEKRIARRIASCTIYRPTLFERLGFGSFNARVQREVRMGIS
jgi:hypothetical protein